MPARRRSASKRVPTCVHGSGQRRADLFFERDAAALRTRAKRGRDATLQLTHFQLGHDTESSTVPTWGQTTVRGDTPVGCHSWRRVTAGDRLLLLRSLRSVESTMVGSTDLRCSARPLCLEAAQCGLWRWRRHMRPDYLATGGSGITRGSCRMRDRSILRRARRSCDGRPTR